MREGAVRIDAILLISHPALYLGCRSWHHCLPEHAADRLPWLRRASPSATLDEKANRSYTIKATFPCQATIETSISSRDDVLLDWRHMNTMILQPRDPILKRLRVSLELSHDPPDSLGKVGLTNIEDHVERLTELP